MSRTLSRTVQLLGLGLALASGPSVATAAGDDWPQRVHDLSYGTILYDHYQGRSLDALTGFAVAEARDGIQGHGDHPQLIRGSVMLAYGMTRQAQALFEALLADSRVDALSRNLAWFYLGKVYYLEDDNSRSQQALARVTAEVLAADAPDDHEQWLYLQGQLALRVDGAGADSRVEALAARLPTGSLYRHYLRYNLASARLAAGHREAALATLEQLASQLQATAPAQDGESQALLERTQLSLGELYLQQSRHRDAQSRLASIRLDSPFSDQALYHYALASAGTESWGLALQALDTLQQRPLFSPWLQQVPYARGHVLEQLQRPQQAMVAYRNAAERYQTLQQQLAQARAQLTEASIVGALQPLASVADGQPPGQSAVTLGDPALSSDAYGRLQLQPGDPALAQLLSQEPFQLALRDLHELYRLQRLMTDWQDKLASFDAMLVTRQSQRQRKIADTRAALQAQQADQWLGQQQRFQRRIDAALVAEDADFFMSEPQRAAHRRIQRVLATLATLPDDERTASQRRKIARIQAYFDWQVTDDYGVNRWATQKQLRQLNQAMAEFRQRRTALAGEMAGTGGNASLARRISASGQRLETLAGELELALSQARAELLARVKADFDRQQQTVQRYLVASRHAQARLADAVFSGADDRAEEQTDD